MPRCDRCNGETKLKTITSKKTGQRYDVYECLEGCKSKENSRFAYSFFPPKTDGKSKPAPKTNGAQNGSNEAVNLLRSIDTSLKNLLVIAQKKSGLIPIQDNELEPDNEIPF